MFIPQSLIRFIGGVPFGVVLSILLLGEAAASDTERYKAVPLGTNGASVLILDTREGHIWTWLNTGALAPNGGEPSSPIVYQGNVRQHMKTPDKQPAPSGASSSRF